ncbi:hypothetical protein [Agrococcus sp. SGAir0287]|uniref:hypothetical protein n=1 Tax=Agrococcus sp. SGAir0287 TaxID=2070347 RepID=UPI0010CCCEFB|nr:hypothetical protein [Agrococcus sp. SGAir0287]QCR19395.1 hypothetical protein C1N71_08105 [Agrococcus sp. SGAir0287]
MTEETRDDDLRWFRGERAIEPSGAAARRPGMPPGDMPRGVRAVVVQGAVAGAAQILVGTAGGWLLAREVDVVLGIVVGAIVLIAGVASLVGVTALARGSAIAFRIYGGPLDRDVLMIGLQGWARQRLRTPESRRWFRAHADARARMRGGTPQRPAP